MQLVTRRSTDIPGSGIECFGKTQSSVVITVVGGKRLLGSFREVTPFGWKREVRHRYTEVKD